MEYVYIYADVPVYDSVTHKEVKLERFTTLESLNKRKNFHLFGDPKLPASYIYFKVKDTGQEVYLTYDWAVVENTEQSMKALDAFLRIDEEFRVLEKQRNEMRKLLHTYK
ncbi:hypothetical protein CPL00229_CDS0101 [Escherichia phage vB_Eco_mar004NP2]|jgi:hypothetical protein|uniref:Uncharacterized protein n=1 Tax=Escherichia phage vB_Eco_mar004NP2 TaxID=2419762 RepID=A0A3P4A776_9CAUD|nr:hypothetical protein HOV62_gp040 [Escherichia phage vB_Eco_mar004NP2]WNT48398.1 hypothetical protein SPLA5b_PHROGS00056 [Salmonella phage SPLA5b]BEU75864.1 hypothetical protein KSS14E_1050 [Escherichia coli phage KS_S14]VCU43567.1 hypothetical protein MAR004NP2_00173 [Escherichia phage vB_Eco_mar004NP2]